MHRALAVQQTPRQFGKAFLPYVYISALSIFTPQGGIIFHYFCSEKSRNCTAPSIPNSRKGVGQRVQVPSGAKFGFLTIPNTLPTVQVLRMKRFPSVHPTDIDKFSLFIAMVSQNENQFLSLCPSNLLEEFVPAYGCICVISWL